jgi:hypothetical protein
MWYFGHFLPQIGRDHILGGDCFAALERSPAQLE